MQSYLAQKSLNSQLQRLGALSSNECISMFSEDFEIFRTSMDSVNLVILLIHTCICCLLSLLSPVIFAVWVDQGDEISLEYSGTHALKRDLVR